MAALGMVPPGGGQGNVRGLLTLQPRLSLCNGQVRGVGQERIGFGGGSPDRAKALLAGGPAPLGQAWQISPLHPGSGVAQPPLGQSLLQTWGLSLLLGSDYAEATEQLNF